MNEKEIPTGKEYFILVDLQEELNFTRASLRKLREETGIKLRVDLEKDCSRLMAEFPAEVTLYIINKTKVVVLLELIAKLNPDYQEIKILDDMHPANPNAD